VLKNKKKISLLNRQCAAMLAAPIMGHDVIFTLFGCVLFWRIFSQLQITFEGWGDGEGKASYWPSIMQNSC
jgi:hypothetical protein